MAERSRIDNNSYENDDKYNKKPNLTLKRSAFIGVTFIFISVLYLIPLIVHSTDAAGSTCPLTPPDVVQLPHEATMSSKVVKIVSLDFEVFGKVQGVWFRKHTKSEADRLRLRGWCENTSHKTVRGQIQGEEDNLLKMKSWLQTTGSPMSKIDRAEFKNEKQILESDYSSFAITR